MATRRPAHAKNFGGRAKNIPAEPMMMLPYQQKWIDDRSLMKLMEKTRRCGVSYGTANELVERHALKTNNLDSWVSSRDELTAREFILMCKGFAQTYDTAARFLGEQVLDDDAKHSAQVLRFANDRRINSVASNPDVFVGKGGRIRLDEFAIRNDPRGVYNIAYPCISWGGDMGVISTHRGSGNYFNKLIREIHEKGNPKGWSHHRVTLQDALEQHFLWKLQTKLHPDDPRMEMDEGDYFDYQRASCSDNETFLQEFMCEPADDLGAFLEYMLIDACTYKRGVKWEWSMDTIRRTVGTELGEFYGGVDIGRKKDLTSFWMLQKVGGQFLTIKQIDLQNIPFSKQEEILYPYFQHCRRVCIDATGLGMQFAEDAGRMFGQYKVESVTFTNKVKEELAYPVRSAFEDRAIRIPWRDQVTADLRSVKKEITGSGNIRFSADHGPDGHADRFWALALALHAAKGSGGEFGFDTIVDEDSFSPEPEMRSRRDVIGASRGRVLYELPKRPLVIAVNFEPQTTRIAA